MHVLSFSMGDPQPNIENKIQSNIQLQAFCKQCYKPIHHLQKVLCLKCAWEQLCFFSSKQCRSTILNTNNILGKLKLLIQGFNFRFNSWRVSNYRQFTTLLLFNISFICYNAYYFLFRLKQFALINLNLQIIVTYVIITNSRLQNTFYHILRQYIKL